MPRLLYAARGTRRTLALALAAVALVAMPTAASARPGRAAEPVVVVPGLGENCYSVKVDSADNPVLRGKVYEGLRAAIDSSGGAVDPVPADDVLGWRFSACHRTLSILAQQLDAYLAKVQAGHGGGPVDLVSFSFGGAIIRYCLTNPRGATPGCARRVDDWVGIVNATNGTLKADFGTCLAAGLVGLFPICDALSRGSTEIKRMNRGDPSPGPIDYTMFWTPEDDYLYPRGTSELAGARNVSMSSELGPVTHLGSWLGPCTTTEYWVGVELADLGAHRVRDEAIDCNTMPPGVIPPPSPTTPPTPAPAPTPANPGAPSDTGASTAASR